MGDVTEGELVTLELAVRIPVSATEKQVEEWLQYEVGDNGSISGDNPLINYGIQTWGPSGFNWERTGEIGVRETFDHEDLPDGGTRYRVRYRRTPLTPEKGE